MALKTNEKNLVEMSVIGQVSSPRSGASPYRITHDGKPVVLPGVGDEVGRSPVMDEVVGGDVEVSGPVAGVAVSGSTCGRTSWAFGSKAKPDDSRSAGACWRCSIGR